jgi:hypothetical protein
MFPIFGNSAKQNSRAKDLWCTITLARKKALKGGVNVLSIPKNEEVRVLRLTEMSRTSG